jgi:secreted PhoX family phosphatase
MAFKAFDGSLGSPRGMERRGFLRGAAVAAGVAALEALGARAAGAAPMQIMPFSPDYGPLYPARDHTTGLELLLLPRGFEYLSHGWTGDLMGDRIPTPSAHDGMAAFRVGDRVTLVRNHEQGAFTGKFTDPAYDPAANGGTTNLVFDPAGQFVDSWASLSGTIRNCAGGPTPWGSWLTCEETTVINPVSGLRHGYVFEVPASGTANPSPLTAMGRFSHEAVAVDPATGWVYETEDANPSGFYRFRPNTFGDLAAGGILEMLVLNGGPYDTRTDATGTTYASTSWVPISNPDWAPGEPTPVQQGIAQGGAIFARLEGAFFAGGKVYIVSTSGGPIGQGQVFEYQPSTGAMRVLFASPDPQVLNNPDNICVSPRGGIVLCEDGSGVEYLHGLTTDGEIFRFAANNVVVPPEGVPGKVAIAPGNYTGSEWAGSTFEPKNGNWLFVNIQTPGITFAITGPWPLGSL